MEISNREKKTTTKEKEKKTIKIKEDVKKEKTLVIYLCCYNEETEKKATQYENQHSYFKKHKLKQSEYFENELLFYLNKNKDELDNVDYVGCLASTFENKIRMVPFEKNALEKDIDVLYFTGCKRSVRETAPLWFHPNLLKIFEITLKKLGEPISILDEHIDMFFCNYWIMKKHVLLDYLEFLNKVVTLWEDPKEVELSKLLWEDANYCKKYVSYELKMITGVPYYTYHAFILERMIFIFCALRNYKCVFNG